MNAPANLERARFKMIEQQIRPSDVLDPRVLDLLKIVKREEFLSPSHKALAFVDMQLPLLDNAEQAMRLGQCMLEPKLEARMLQEANPKPHEKVLEVGTGSGYMAALLGHRAAEVTTLEIDPALARIARANLQRAGVTNVNVREGDGTKGWSANAPYDLIVLSGSVAQAPQALLQQLKVGGRLVAVVGDEPVMRLAIVTRASESSFTTAEPWDTSAPRLRNFGETSVFHF